MFAFRYSTLIICFLLTIVQAAPSSLVRRTNTQGFPPFSDNKIALPAIGAIGNPFVNNGKPVENIYHLVGAYKPLKHVYGPSKEHPSGSLLVMVWKEASDDAYEQLASLKKANNLVTYGMLTAPLHKLGSTAPVPVIIYLYEASYLTGSGNDQAGQAQAKTLADVQKLVKNTNYNNGNKH
ncbi:hypothetical protein BT96DRAFT_934732 [Gymnopus androsaceus JB14]|uniref:Uncharacterized protein n=1 Tax=Gymnopus androsaceus JB14 TaxID=1447944 RepID=A0A6A4I7B8_9AGAR|nr:hypothetical protein BT96DRAFT_934732 [Gymnopus androsaceus JB14]